MNPVYLTKGDLKKDILRTLSNMAALTWFVDTCRSAAIGSADYIVVQGMLDLPEEQVREIAKWYDESPHMDIAGDLVQSMALALVLMGKVTPDCLERMSARIDQDNGIDRTKRTYHLGTISGVLDDWIRENRKPADAEFVRDGEIVKINGTLPLAEIQ